MKLPAKRSIHMEADDEITPAATEGNPADCLHGRKLLDFKQVGCHFGKHLLLQQHR